SGVRGQVARPEPLASGAGRADGLTSPHPRGAGAFAFAHFSARFRPVDSYPPYGGAGRRGWVSRAGPLHPFRRCRRCPMSPISRCPPAQDLRQFLLGQLTSPEADRLSEHLPDCPSCLAAVATLEAEDSLVKALRTLGAAEGTDADLLATLLRRAQGL